jgi:hypothetical protein
LWADGHPKTEDPDRPAMQDNRDFSVDDEMKLLCPSKAHAAIGRLLALWHGPKTEIGVIPLDGGLDVRHYPCELLSEHCSSFPT